MVTRWRFEEPMCITELGERAGFWRVIAEDDDGYGGLSRGGRAEMTF